MDFFRLFGRVLNMRDVGMASSGGGHFYRKVCVEVMSYICTCVCVCVSACVCACVCVWFTCMVRSVMLL